MLTQPTAAAPHNDAELRTFADQTALSHAAAQEIVSQAQAAVELHGSFTIALSGGPAPAPVFDLLADPGEPFRARMPWSNTHFFWGDERHVPPDHPQSNYRLAHRHMLSKVDVPEENVHRVRAELPDAHETAELYELTLRDHFRLAAGELPRFDLMLQGLGANGHTASLFPGTTALAERERLVVATWVEKLQAHRITTTIPVINHAARVLFVVSGTEPADALAQVLFGPRLSQPLPAMLIEPGPGRLLWLADAEAASRVVEPDSHRVP